MAFNPVAMSPSLSLRLVVSLSLSVSGIDVAGDAKKGNRFKLGTLIPLLRYNSRIVSSGSHRYCSSLDVE